MHKPIPKSQSPYIRPTNKYTSLISTTITIKIKGKKNLHNFKFWKDDKVAIEMVGNGEWKMEEKIK